LRHGELVGSDLHPYTEDPIAAVRRSILQWDFILYVASRIDRAAIADARKMADATWAMQTVYATLGLDREFEIAAVLRRQARRDSKHQSASA